MIARKCDRCGQFYEIPKIGELCGFAWLTGYDTDGETQFGKQYDLCADCTSELSDFMEGKPEPEKIPYEKPVIGDSAEEVTKPKKEKVPLTDEQKDAILNAYLDGQDIKTITSNMGLTVKQVNGFILSKKRHNPELFETKEEPVDSQPE